MKDINYDEILDIWHDKVVGKADKILEEANDCEVGSKEYLRYRSFADGLYTALAMLSLEERKAKRKLK